MSYLYDDPWTIKDAKGSLKNGLEFGFVFMQGQRKSIQDTYMTELTPATLPQGCSFFVVFDQQIGRMIADLSSEKVTEQLVNAIRDVVSDGKTEDADPNKIGNAIRNAVLSLDSFRNSNPSDYCATIAVLITPTHIIVASTGDSRCVLAKASHAVTMSFDDEFSDAESESDLETQANICLEQLRERRADSLEDVSAEPDIYVHKIDKTEEFLVLVCGGMWGRMSNDEVCIYVRDIMNKDKTDLEIVTTEVLYNCLRARNVVIVKFPGAKVGECDGVDSLREQRSRLEQAE